MKLNRLETHDRLQHLIKDQSANIYQGAEDCLKKNPLSLAIQERSPYIYIFAHPRTADDGVNKVMYWDPRLSIPEPQTNSYLFRAISKTDLIEVIWMIPPKEQWKQYEKGKVTESNWSYWSIEQFKHNRKNLEKPNPEDLSEEYTSRIMQQVINEKIEEIRANQPFFNIQSIIDNAAERQQKMMENLYSKPPSEEESSTSSE
jgi:hypothetical protein